ncbi:MAG: Endolytic murein transglycosylase, partial [Anaerolineales bacterium]|nr:Endolytic murein transglycosylase [Anaerolineales bacterium]
ATSPAFIASLGLFQHISNQVEDSSKNRRGLTLEGYLFPDTYHFIKEMEPEEVIRMIGFQWSGAVAPAPTPVTLSPTLIVRQSSVRRSP